MIILFFFAFVLGFFYIFFYQWHATTSSDILTSCFTTFDSPEHKFVKTLNNNSKLKYVICGYPLIGIFYLVFVK